MYVLERMYSINVQLFLSPAFVRCNKLTVLIDNIIATPELISFWLVTPDLEYSLQAIRSTQYIFSSEVVEIKLTQ